MEIEFVTGDLIQAAVEGKLPQPWIIPHVVNNQGKWGAGFVVPLGKAFPQAKQDYQTSLAYGDLGYNMLTILSKETAICHMVAQTLGGPRPLYYNYLAQCMTEFQAFCPKETICCPRFGAGLAGGKWEFIEELINDCWIRAGIPVQVWTLPEEVNKYAAH